jgi:hypothetical protein
MKRGKKVPRVTAPFLAILPFCLAGCSGVLEVLCWRWVGAETCLVVKV